MTEPRHDLPTDPQLSRLYREHAVDEPAGGVDQRILAVARQSVASGSPGTLRRTWWQRWRMPFSLATTVMLTVMLALLVERQPTDPSVAPSREKEVIESAQQHAEPVSKPPAPAKAVQLPASQFVPKVLPKAPVVSQSERNSSGASNRAADQAKDAPSSSTKAEGAPAASVPREAAVSSEIRAAPALSAAPPAAAPMSKERADSSRSPVVWLDEIRALRSAGKIDEAERQLREFRLAYPEYLLPEEFRQ